MPGLHQVVEALGEVKVVDGIVAEGEVQHHLKGDGLDDPGGDVEDEKFDLQLVVDETAAFHKRHLQM